MGKQYTPQDPHVISPNGSILAEIVMRQHLVVANGTHTCKGTITRKRVTRNRTEQSAIDLVLLSNDMLKHLVELYIDEDRNHVLTKVTKTNKVLKYNIVITILC